MKLRFEKHSIDDVKDYYNTYYNEEETENSFYISIEGTDEKYKIETGDHLLFEDGQKCKINQPLYVLRKLIFSEFSFLSLL